MLATGKDLRSDIHTALNELIERHGKAATGRQAQAGAISVVSNPELDEESPVLIKYQDGKFRYDSPREQLSRAIDPAKHHPHERNDSALLDSLQRFASSFQSEPWAQLRSSLASEVQSLLNNIITTRGTAVQGGLRESGAQMIAQIPAREDASPTLIKYADGSFRFHHPARDIRISLNPTRTNFDKNATIPVRDALQHFAALFDNPTPQLATASLGLSRFRK